MAGGACYGRCLPGGACYGPPWEPRSENWTKRGIYIYIYILGKPKGLHSNVVLCGNVLCGVSCATYSIIRKIDILLDSQYTGNKRV